MKPRWLYREQDRLLCPECRALDRFQLLAQYQSVTRDLTVRVESIRLRCDVCRCVWELNRAGVLKLVEKPVAAPVAVADGAPDDSRADSDLRGLYPRRR